MKKHRYMQVFVIWLLAVLATTTIAFAEMKIGVGRTIITPEHPMWMAGYASRKAPSDGKVHELWTKAMAIEDADGNRIVILTSDLIALTMDITDAVSARIDKEHGISRSNLLFNASHTHSGPVVRNEGLHGMYGLSEEENSKAIAYTKRLHDLLFDTIDMAVKDLESGTLSWGIGEAFFAKNRREYTVNGVINRFNPIGPVDHDVPILMAKDGSGAIKGILFGYACHNTTVGFQEFSGDYAGYAQIHLEQAYPGATALFAAGCGADQNPLPRRTVELAERFGRELGEAVEAVLGGEMTAVDGELRTQYKVIELALTEAPSEEEVMRQLQDDNVYVVRRAKKMQATYQREGKLPVSLPYPVQVWQLGDAVQLTALSGEVVVDYSLLIKHEYPREKQFVMGYSNDCPAYIPSLRVLREGGYEGGDAMVYYGVHGLWAPSIEQRIMSTVRELASKED